MYIESHLTLRQHPKTEAAMKALNATREAVIGYLHMLWWWCFEYAPTGNLSRFSPDQIATAAGWPGDGSAFVDAMVSVRFLDRRKGRIFIHHWDKYGGKLHRRRLADVQRKRAGRAKDVHKTSEGHPTDGGRTAYVDKNRVYKEDKKVLSTSTTAMPLRTTGPEPIKTILQRVVR